MAERLTSSEHMMDISELDYKSLKGMISTEDLERLEEKKPQTMHAAVRAGLK